MSQLTIEKIFQGKLSKLIVSYYVLIKKRIMLLTGTVPALKNIFLGHFCVTDKLTDGRKVCLTELHVAAKKLRSKYFTVLEIYLFLLTDKSIM